MTDALPDWLREHVAAGNAEPMEVATFLAIYARHAHESGAEIDLVALGILQSRAWHWLKLETDRVLADARSMISESGSTAETGTPDAGDDPFTVAASALAAAFPDEALLYTREVLDAPDPRRLLVERTRFPSVRKATLVELLSALEAAREDARAAIAAREAWARARASRKRQARAALMEESDDVEIARLRSIFAQRREATLRELAAERSPLGLVGALHAVLHLAAIGEVLVMQTAVGEGPVLVRAPNSHVAITCTR